MIDIKYKKIYDEFISEYENIHISPWHNISHEEINIICNELTNSMDINDISTFYYFINHIIKKLSGTTDAHTMMQTCIPLPMNFKLFDNDLLVNYPDDLKGSSVESVNGISTNKLIKEIDEIITYGTEGKRIYDTEKAFFNELALFGLPSLRNANSLDFKIKLPDGTYIIKSFKKGAKYNLDESFDFEEFIFGKYNATYKIVDDALVYVHSSIQPRFADKIKEAIAKMDQENLDSINSIIIDLRGNWGGNSSLNKPLMDFLNKHKDKKLIVLTDYIIFSGGRYALIDLLNLGAITIGEEIGTPINCFGNSHWIHIDNLGFSISEAYFDPYRGIDIWSKDEFNKKITNELMEPIIFKPTYYIKRTEEDFRNNIDAVYNFAMNLDSKTNKKVM